MSAVSSDPNKPHAAPPRRPPRKLWPVGALWLFAQIVLWTAGQENIDRSAREEAFLLSKDGRDGYLIPVACEGALGIRLEDYIPGHVAIDGNRWGKDVCLYTRPAFNRLFPQRVGDDPATAHEREAEALGARLQRPSKRATIAGMAFVSVVWTIMFAGAAYIAHRGNRRR